MKSIFFSDHFSTDLKNPDDTYFIYDVRIPFSGFQLISTLALFASSKDRCCSRYVRDDQGWMYEPQLAIQGIIVVRKEGKFIF